jgi:hypothetical protein
MLLWIILFISYTVGDVIYAGSAGSESDECGTNETNLCSTFSKAFERCGSGDKNVYVVNELSISEVYEMTGDKTYYVGGVISDEKLPKIKGTETFHLTASTNTEWYEKYNLMIFMIVLGII